MPASASTTTASSSLSSKSANPSKPTELLKFEVSSPKVFHFIFTTNTDVVSVDVGAGSVQKSLSLTIPSVVKSTACSAYSFALPYAQWGASKVQNLVGSGVKSE